MYDKFGELLKVRHIRFHPLIIAIKGPHVITFDSDTKEFLQEFPLVGARVSGLEGRDFVITGPRLGGPWLLRAACPEEALSWCHAFVDGGQAARAVLRLANAKSEAECTEEYRQKVRDALSAVKALAPPFLEPLSPLTQFSALCCRACDQRFDAADHTPLLLPCHHTACRSCLTAQLHMGATTCPTCSAICEPPSGDVCLLPKNYAILEIKGPDDFPFGRAETTFAVETAGGTCPICFDPLLEKVPLVLECGHSMCDECTYGIAVRQRDCELHCPECRQPTSLTTNGALAVNLSLRDAVQELVRLHRDWRRAHRAMARRRWAALRGAWRAVRALLQMLKERKARAPPPKPKGAKAIGPGRLSSSTPKVAKASPRPTPAAKPAEEAPKVTPRASGRPAVPPPKSARRTAPKVAVR